MGDPGIEADPRPNSMNIESESGCCNIRSENGCCNIRSSEGCMNVSEINAGILGNPLTYCCDRFRAMRDAVISEVKQVAVTSINAGVMAAVSYTRIKITAYHVSVLVHGHEYVC